MVHVQFFLQDSLRNIVIQRFIARAYCYLLWELLLDDGVVREVPALCFKALQALHAAAMQHYLVP
jgi:hypothetical protein